MRRSAVFGSTVECAGTSRTSSKVNASCLILNIAISHTVSGLFKMDKILRMDYTQQANDWLVVF